MACFHIFALLTYNKKTYSTGGAKVKKCTYLNILRGEPCAYADIAGSEKYSKIKGKIRFYEADGGVLVAAEVCGLPEHSGKFSCPVFGFHIHSGSCCCGTAEDPFADAGSHYNPMKTPHPYHSGDMPPLFGNCGYAFMVFLTCRFSIHEIIGRTVIIHSMADDFTTQPSGNSGEKIACGVIRSC